MTKDAPPSRSWRKSQNALCIALIFLIAIAAFLLRAFDLSLRPLHLDEAVHCFRLQFMRDDGYFTYNPVEYHGPTLYYFTMPVLWLSGVKDLRSSSEWTYRIVTVVFGTGVVLLPLLMRDGLGKVGAVFAALLAAVSPAMVFYSRYYIQEMLLVFFAGLALAAGWRWYVSRRVGWLVLLGVALGFMHATKETFVLNVVAGGCGVVGVWVWGIVDCRLKIGDWRFGISDLRFRISDFNLKISNLLAIIIPAVVVSVVCFSSFFTHWAGVKDSILAYQVYLGRGAGHNTDHVHAWDYYFRLLFWFKDLRGTVRSEMVIPLLAMVGAVRAFWPGQLLGRFLTIYTIVLTLVYCVIPYKTPWCALGFLHGMILLGGYGAAGIVIGLGEWMHWVTGSKSVRQAWGVAAAMALLIPIGLQAQNAWLLNYDRRMAVDDRFNPYMYAHTLTTIRRLVERVDAIGALLNDPAQLTIQYTTNDYWPLPWYLRRYRQSFPADGPVENPQIIISSADVNELALPADIETGYQTELFGLRHNVLVRLHIRRDLWEEFMKGRSGK